MKRLTIIIALCGLAALAYAQAPAWQSNPQIVRVVLVRYADALIAKGEAIRAAFRYQMNDAELSAAVARVVTVESIYEQLDAEVKMKETPAQ